MKILVTGSNGQLGQELQALQNRFEAFQFIFTDIDNLDITNKGAVSQLFETEKFDVCINCAAYTAVDKAEEEKAKATLINETAVGILAEACKTHNAKLIQISTDFVFNGKGHKPYVEQDAISPVNFYGASKAKGETLALQADGIVLRTSWLYSTFGNNFVKTMLRLGNEREELGIIFDQIGTPTFAKDLAEAVLTICSSDNFKNQQGIYHYSNEGIASWYDFATAIFEISDVNCKTNPILATSYPTPAARPHYSVMDKSKIKEHFKLTIPHWRQSLMQCITAMN